MAFIPKNAQWYLADIVEHITVEGDKRNVVHTNMVLVRADSPEEAYEKAMQLGKDGETTYKNIDDKLVKIRFRGLRNLDVIHDKLEHGAEIGYSEEPGMKEADIKKWVRTKSKLGVFRSRKKHTGPNYASGEVVRMVVEAMRKENKKKKKTNRKKAN